jgi:hypothetical protein
VGVVLVSIIYEQMRPAVDHPLLARFSAYRWRPGH